MVYDDEDAHYDTISAFIKSMRGSDPDAALYWLAKMIHAGEDPRFIARRIVIHAAEDVGLADPMALVLANAAFQAAEFIGWPEARIPLAEAAIYIATATKSNSTVMAIDAALKDVESGRTLAGAGTFARRQLPGRQAAGPRRGLPIRARSSRSISSRRIIWARTSVTTSRPSKGWRRRSRSASRNGGRNSRRPESAVRSPKRSVRL